MANTSTRMLRLLSLLQTHRYWPGGELAQRLEVSERTLRRDIDRLRDLGYPIDASRGVAGGYQLQAGAALPPLLLDDDEAVAIAVGLMTATSGSVEGIEETSVQALAKVVQVMPPRLRRRVDALQASTVPAAVWSGGPTVDASALTVIALSCRDHERLRFRYTTRAGDEASRLVEPHQMVSLGRRWYLVAWDVERHDWRTFRVDRLLEPVATGVRFRPRELPATDAATFVQHRLASIPTRYEVEVVIRASAADVERVIRRWGTVEAFDEESCRLQMNVGELEWPALVLGAVGADFEVIRPTELAEYVRAMGALFVRSSAGG